MWSNMTEYNAFANQSDHLFAHPLAHPLAKRRGARKRGIALSIAALFAIGATTAHAQAREQASLGSLSIPASRVPMWYPLDHLPLDTSTWRVVNVPCGSYAGITSALSSAEPNTVVQLAANCTYSAGNTGAILGLSRSRVVLRGAPGNTSVLEFEYNDSAAMSLGNRGTEAFGDGRTWTAGFAMGDQNLTVASTTGLQVGGWVRLRANNEPDWHVNSRNGYSAKLECVGRTGSHPACATLATNQVRIDRPLNSVFTQGGNVLERMTVSATEFAGIERVRIQHRTPNQIESYRARIMIDGCYECWVTDSSFGDAGNATISIQYSARVVVRGNSFGSNQCTDEGVTCNWNKGAMYFNDHAYDNVFENNSIVNSPSGPLLQNGGGNVVAYNYMRSSSTVACERHIFLHGQGVRASLIEGNDVSCMIQWDSYRDGQGYFNTVYRNRLQGSPATGQSFGGYYRGRLGAESQGSFIHRNMTVIANHANELMGGPFPTGLGLDFSADATHQHRDTWVSHNVSRSAQLFDSRAVRSTLSENYVRTNPLPAWSTLNFPASLYRSQAPSWWCEESGAFPNIGAPSDTAGSYGRLPAQVRLDGGACTPSGGLPAPVLLPNS